MAIFSKDIKTMDDLFEHTLGDIYYAEKKIVQSLPGLIEKASHETLRKGLSDHLAQTRNHVARLEEVFAKLGKDAKAVRCPAIDGIIKEADELAADVADSDVLDAAIIAAAQAVEHYEMTRYGTLVAWAKQLRHDECVPALTATLSEEKDADSKLTRMAESRINAEAAAA